MFEEFLYNFENEKCSISFTISHHENYSLVCYSGSDFNIGKGKQGLFDLTNWYEISKLGRVLPWQIVSYEVASYIDFKKRTGYSINYTEYNCDLDY